MFALVVSTRGSVDDTEISAMAAALRGNDGPISIFRELSGKFAAACGVAGLLPEDAHDRQPINSEDIVFVSSGRLDNRDEIFERLNVPQRSREMLADSDALHMAYRHWGEDCLQYLAGDFAFVAYHRASGRTVVAVDHYGPVRVYYALVGGRLVVATQLGAMLANPWVPNELDLKALGFIIAPKVEIDTTPYREIRHLPGGHLLVFQAGNLKLREWWSPSIESTTRYRDPRDYVQQARELLENAVKACLRSTTPVATTLSGGLDSTLVAGVAASRLQKLGREIRAYAAVPEAGLSRMEIPGWDSDDTPYAQAVARMHKNMDLEFVTPGGICTLDMAPRIHALSHTVTRNSANNLWFGRICEKAALQGSRVLLVGQKGNATISFDGHGATGAFLSRFQWAAAWKLLRDSAKGRSLPRVLASELLGPDSKRWLRRSRGNFERAGVRVLSESFRSEYGHLLLTPTNAGSLWERRAAFTKSPAKHWGPDTLTQWNVELRDPLANRHLVEALLKFPLEAFSTGSTHRGLARAVGEGYVPDAVRFRRTRGQQMSEICSIVAAHAVSYRRAVDAFAQSSIYRHLVDVPSLGKLVAALTEGKRDRTTAWVVDRAVDVGLFVG